MQTERHPLPYPPFTAILRSVGGSSDEAFYSVESSDLAMNMALDDIESCPPRTELAIVRAGVTFRRVSVLAFKNPRRLRPR